MYVKICGLQTLETVAAAVTAGADAVGFVFAPGSPRTITPEQAAQLVGGVPDDVETVGVFRNQNIEQVLDFARRAGITTVQLHGEETLADLAQVQAAGFRTFRAVSAAAFKSMDDGEQLGWGAERLLLDAVEPGAGVVFDASMLQSDRPQGFWLLAGGLTPQNVAAMITALSPDGVDVSSGVESDRGVKDVDLIKAFVEAAHEARHGHLGERH